MKLGLLVAIVLAAASPAAAQALPVIPVFGSGSVAFDMNLTAAEAQALTYRAYIASRPPIALTVTCTGTTTLATCVFPLSQLVLVPGVAVSFELAAVVVAADGTQEARVRAPFDLRRLGPPAAPVLSSIAIRPAP